MSARPEGHRAGEFRLGTMYEKGLDGKKDIQAARRYYVLAAERGNAKAMHNLAVLDADGGGKGPDYKSAAAGSARRPTTASPTASTISASSMPAASASNRTSPSRSNGSASRRRRAIPKRPASATTSPSALDPQSQAAAKLAIQGFTPEPQPDDATTSQPPPADGTAPPAAPAKPGGKPRRASLRSSAPRAR